PPPLRGRVGEGGASLSASEDSPPTLTLPPCGGGNKSHTKDDRAMILSRTLAALCVSAATLVVFAQDTLPGKPDEKDANLIWYDTRALGLEGQGWKDTKAPSDRLPASAEKEVDASVWGLSHHSAGLCVRFVTDSPAIQAKWTLTGNLAMNHMPATGVSGLDLYTRSAKDGKWQWLSVGRPNDKGTNTAILSRG